MSDYKTHTGVKKRYAEYHEGKEAVVNFAAGMKAVATVSKERIVELEKKPAAKRKK